MQPLSKFQLVIFEEIDYPNIILKCKGFRIINQY